MGYFVCAFFLDLIIFEPFYFLLILITANYYLVKNAVEKNTGIEGIRVSDLSEDYDSHTQKVTA